MDQAKHNIRTDIAPVQEETKGLLDELLKGSVK